ncbi:hypothetical protein AAVH_10107 [Aphelenchoides avenae]|nr:hypothetical protein AAVH_10107 [Aphelenchus avenae]
MGAKLVKIEARLKLEKYIESIITDSIRNLSASYDHLLNSGTANVKHAVDSLSLTGQEVPKNFNLTVGVEFSHTIDNVLPSATDHVLIALAIVVATAVLFGIAWLAMFLNIRSQEAVLLKEMDEVEELQEEVRLLANADDSNDSRRVRKFARKYERMARDQTLRRCT